MADRPVIGITCGIIEGRYALRKEYAEAVESAGGTAVMLPPLKGLVQYYARQIDGLILPGGDDIDPSYYGESMCEGLVLEPNERVDFDIALFREIIDLDKPVLGICYGMQLMNVALGGSLIRDIASEVPGSLGHREGTHDIEVRGGPFTEGTYRVGSSHHQAVKSVAPALEVIARTDDGIIEAVYMKGRPFTVGVEWHPERSSDDVISPEVFRHFIGVSSEA